MNNKPKSTFELKFFLISALFLSLVGLRFGGLNPLNIGLCAALLASAPLLAKVLGKKYKPKESEVKNPNDLKEMTVSELADLIKKLYTSRGFSLELYSSGANAVRYTCTRKGTRKGENFTERGAILVIKTDEVINVDAFNLFKIEMKERTCSQGTIITTSRFSPEVIDLAKDTYITLWNGEYIRDKLVNKML